MIVRLLLCRREKFEALPQMKWKTCRNNNTTACRCRKATGSFIFVRLLNKRIKLKACKGYRVGTSACIFCLLNHCRQLDQICYWWCKVEVVRPGLILARISSRDAKTNYLKLNNWTCKQVEAICLKRVLEQYYNYVY